MCIFTLIQTKLSKYRYSNSVIPNPTNLRSKALGTNENFDFLLRLQIIIGCCPISYEGTKRKKYYYFKWTTPRAALNFFATLYFSFHYVIFITHCTFSWFFLFGEEIRYVMTNFEEQFKTEVLINGSNKMATVKSFSILICLNAIYEMINMALSWISSSKLAEYLNNWTMIRKQFALTFPEEDIQEQENTEFKKHLQTDQGTRRGMLRFDIALCFYVLLMGLVPIFILPNFMSVNSPNIQKWLLYSYALHTVITEALEDVKNFLMYKSCSDAFKTVRTSISRDIRLGQISEASVQSWRQILMDIRGQCELCGKCLMPRQLTFVCNFIISGSLCIYVGLHSFGISRISRTITFLTGMCVTWWMSRLYFKVLMAEKITEAEAEIATDMVKMDSARYSASVMAQIRLTHDTLVLKPSRINLDNYVVLNKRLYRRVVGQVITYLIVLMQFFQTNNSSACNCV